MSDKALRSKIIRLAHQKPELRKDLLPLVTKSSASFNSKLTQEPRGKYKRNPQGWEMSDEKMDLDLMLKIISSGGFEIIKKGYEFVAIHKKTKGSTRVHLDSDHRRWSKSAQKFIKQSKVVEKEIFKMENLGQRPDFQTIIGLANKSGDTMGNAMCYEYAISLIKNSSISHILR